MKIVNFGSLNLDFVYQVDHMVTPGETIQALSREAFLGGKGLNQSIALARAGASVMHVGCIGSDGNILVDALKREGIDTSLVKTIGDVSGHAIIQVDSKGQNSIVLFGGANLKIDSVQVEEALSRCEPGDWILLQNEISCVAEIIQKAHDKGIQIAFNPSPISASLFTIDLRSLSLLVLNEIEGESLTSQKDVRAILHSLEVTAKDLAVVLTLGKQGAVYHDHTRSVSHGTYKIPVVDTTGAGDTFTGFFLAQLISGAPIEDCLRIASIASSLAVSVKGASVSIPTLAMVQEAKLSLA
jgi:ribokinase